MTQTSETTTGNDNKRPFIVRLLIALFRLVFWAALIGGVIAGGLYLQNEISLLEAQLAAEKGRVDLLRSDVDTYALGGVPELENELNTLSATVANATQDIEQLEGRTAEQAAALSDLSGQAATLETGLGELTTAADSTATEAAALREDAATLRNDLTIAQDSLVMLDTAQDDTVSDITALSAALASLSGQTSTLAEDLTAVEALNADIFATIRVWGLLTQARLSLATDDVPAAQIAIKSAQTAVAALLDSESATLAETMSAVKASLDEAANVLPTDEAAASDSLEAAWGTLDLTLSTALGYAEIEADIAGAEEETADESETDSNEDSDSESEDSSDDSDDD